MQFVCRVHSAKSWLHLQMFLQGDDQSVCCCAGVTGCATGRDLNVRQVRLSSEKRIIQWRSLKGKQRRPSLCFRCKNKNKKKTKLSLFLRSRCELKHPLCAQPGAAPVVTITQEKSRKVVQLCSPSIQNCVQERLHLSKYTWCPSYRVQ